MKPTYIYWSVSLLPGFYADMLHTPFLALELLVFITRLAFTFHFLKLKSVYTTLELLVFRTRLAFTFRFSKLKSV